MYSKIKHIAERLREKDFRLTPQRQAILETLIVHQDEHLTAEDIFKIAKDKYPDLGLATVYRTLELFAELGVIYKLQFNEDYSRYEYNPDGDKHSHHHLVCIQCGEITEFDQDLLEHLEAEITRKNDFKITDHSLRFYGYCSKCSKAKKGSE
ncbi:MAG: Fur family transcriptional regulator [bacterium]|jgi:Fur family ferric uptake transcriptional regulator